MSDLRSRVDSWFAELATRMHGEADRGATPEGETLTVRQLLHRFDYYRRGPYFVSVIRDRLEAHKLRSSPDFEFENVDNPISIELIREFAEAEWIDPTIRVRILPAATNPPERVTPDHTLVRATTLMRLNDYSQLPVMTSDHVVKGMISWRSIGEAYAEGNSPEFVRECLEKEHIVDINMTLVDATDDIYQYDCVLVRDEHNKITGIVTAADLAAQFRQHAYPFLLVGEVEHNLRNLVTGKYTVNELKAVSDGNKEILGPNDLTLGGYCRLMENPENWEKLGLNVDRASFLERIHKVRHIRNDIVHFSTDDLDPSDIDYLHKVAQFFRKLGRFRQRSK